MKMAKLVDYLDVLWILEYCAENRWTADEIFNEALKWNDFIVTDDWKSVDEELPAEKCKTWVCFENGTIEMDNWNGDRGECGQYAIPVIRDSRYVYKFIRSGWYQNTDDSGNRITHWKKVTIPRPPIIKYIMPLKNED